MLRKEEVPELSDGHMGDWREGHRLMSGRTLVEAADEMEQQLAAGLREGQIAEFVENDDTKTR